MCIFLENDWSHFYPLLGNLLQTNQPRGQDTHDRGAGSFPHTASKNIFIPKME